MFGARETVPLKDPSSQSRHICLDVMLPGDSRGALGVTRVVSGRFALRELRLPSVFADDAFPTRFYLLIIICCTMAMLFYDATNSDGRRRRIISIAFGSRVNSLLAHNGRVARCEKQTITVHPHQIVQGIHTAKSPVSALGTL